MESWFCYNLFFYFTESFYAILLKYCKWKALLSPQKNYPRSYSHMWWHRVLSVYTMPAYTVWYSSNNDSGKLTKKRKLVRDKTHFWCSAYESFSIDIVAIRLIMPLSLWSVTSSSFSWISWQLCELKGVSILCVNALSFSALLPCTLSPPPPSFSLVQRCWCTKKACLWFYQRLM